MVPSLLKDIVLVVFTHSFACSPRHPAYMTFALHVPSRDAAPFILYRERRLRSMPETYGEYWISALQVKVTPL